MCLLAEPGLIAIMGIYGVRLMKRDHRPTKLLQDLNWGALDHASRQFLVKVCVLVYYNVYYIIYYDNHATTVTLPAYVPRVNYMPWQSNH